MNECNAMNAPEKQLDVCAIISICTIDYMETTKTHSWRGTRQAVKCRQMKDMMAGFKFPALPGVSVDTPVVLCSLTCLLVFIALFHTTPHHFLPPPPSFHIH